MWSVQIRNFIPVDQDEIQETKQKTVEVKLLSIATVVDLWTIVTLLIELIRILTNTHTTKIMPFWPLLCESEAILSKMLRPVTEIYRASPAGVMVVMCSI